MTIAMRGKDVSAVVAAVTTRDGRFRVRVELVMRQRRRNAGGVREVALRREEGRVVCIR